jgi:hypothetical protein
MRGVRRNANKYCPKLLRLCIPDFAGCKIVLAGSALADAHIKGEVVGGYCITNCGIFTCSPTMITSNGIMKPFHVLTKPQIMKPESYYTYKNI